MKRMNADRKGRKLPVVSWAGGGGGGDGSTRREDAIEALQSAGLRGIFDLFDGLRASFRLAIFDWWPSTAGRGPRGVWLGDKACWSTSPL
jgi:hypothetical protein